MSASIAAPEVLSREFLEIRAKVLELAAALDRIDRAAGSVQSDPRLQSIERGLAALTDAGPGRAERVQMIFSLPYEENWRTELAIERHR